jgi:hypothetical protein
MIILDERNRCKRERGIYERRFRSKEVVQSVRECLGEFETASCKIMGSLRGRRAQNSGERYQDSPQPKITKEREAARAWKYLMSSWARCFYKDISGSKQDSVGV